MILLELFYTFFKIGLFTFGGGYAMLPFIQQEAIAHAWLTEEEIINFVAVSESTPGPFAINMATFVGVEKAGIIGGIIATLGVVLPSFIVILIVAKCFFAFRNSKFVNAAMSGIRPAAIGLIGAAVCSVFLSVFVTPVNAVSDLISYEYIISAVIFAFVLFLVLKKKSPILGIGIAAAAGIAAGYIGELL